MKKTNQKKIKQKLHFFTKTTTGIAKYKILKICVKNKVWDNSKNSIWIVETFSCNNMRTLSLSWNLLDIWNNLYRQNFCCCRKIVALKWRRARLMSITPVENWNTLSPKLQTVQEYRKICLYKICIKVTELKCVHHKMYGINHSSSLKL